jgi:hypothetical protein
MPVRGRAVLLRGDCVTALAEFLRVMRVAQTRLAVRWCEHRLERARHELADAYDAADKAWAELQIHHTAPPPPSPPVFLRAANVQPINRKVKA